MAADQATFPAMSIEQAHALLTSPGQIFEMEDTDVRGVTLRTYKHAPQTLRDIFMLCRQHGERDYLVYEDERVTFNTYFNAVAHMANILRDKYGVQKGDRVAICMRNYPQWPVAFGAAVAIGAIATPMNSWWRGEELEYGFKDCGAKVAFLDIERVERLREHMVNLPELKHVIIARCSEEQGDPRMCAMEDLIGEANDWAKLETLDLPEADLVADDDATIMYTSGTTGLPKGALATHRAIISNIFNSMASQARSFLRNGETIPTPDPNEPQKVMLLSVPFFHATGAFAIMLPNIIRGVRIITQYKWDPLEALDIIQRERVNAIGGVPTIVWQVLEHPDRDKYDLSSIDTVSYGGAPSAPELVASVRKNLNNSTVGNGWGMTETCATCTLNFGMDYVMKPDSAGVAGPAMDIKVVGPDGETLPAGEVGELWAKGPAVVKCYWNKPEASAETFVDGWVITGDLARMDEEGFVYILDRAKDMLIRGGENIYCIEVENVLYDHPEIMDAAIVGIPHKVLGEEVGAVVQLTPGSTLTEDEVRSFAASHLAAFKVPVQVKFSTDVLPRNAAGKILKPELRALFTGDA